MKDIAKIIRDLREETGLSIRDLAEKIDISHSSLDHYEKGMVFPNLRSAIKIAEYFKIPIDYLVYGKTHEVEFHDSSLLEVFKKVDTLSDKNRGLAIKYMKRLIAHEKEQEALKKIF
ncbi:MAG: helix-turn-helix transcriptional regulator [Cyclobacteriaceae bacterium]|nr:helix-turn-helix transcriptional regulator [Cyclobacteriaceae bacterium]